MRTRPPRRALAAVAGVPAAARPRPWRLCPQPPSASRCIRASAYGGSGGSGGVYATPRVRGVGIPAARPPLASPPWSALQYTPGHVIQRRRTVGTSLRSKCWRPTAAPLGPRMAYATRASGRPRLTSTHVPTRSGPVPAHTRTPSWVRLTPVKGAAYGTKSRVHDFAAPLTAASRPIELPPRVRAGTSAKLDITWARPKPLTRLNGPTGTSDWRATMRRAHAERPNGADGWPPSRPEKRRQGGRK